MEEKYYCRGRKLVLKILAFRRFLIQTGTDQKKILLSEVQMQEQKISFLFSDVSISRYVKDEYEIIKFFIPSNKQEWIKELDDLLLESERFCQ
jgi:hypothetical protein